METNNSVIAGVAGIAAGGALIRYNERRILRNLEAKRARKEMEEKDKVSAKERAYAFIDNLRADWSTRGMVNASKKSNRELKRGNFQKAELLRRKAERKKRRALFHGRYDQERLINTHWKAHDGDVIRHNTKVKSIEKLD